MIYLSGEMYHNKEEGDHSYSTLGEGAIMKGKCRKGQQTLFISQAFFFRNPHTKGFQHRKSQARVWILKCGEGVNHNSISRKSILFTNSTSMVSSYC